MLLRFLFPAICWALLIFLLCIAPSDQLPDTSIWDFISFDKVAHLFIFSVFSLLIIVGLRRQYSYSALRYHAKRVAFLAASVYGVIIEFIQQVMNSGRHFEWMDVVADVIGSLLGITLFRIIYGKELAR
ncbi:MAG TPA: VanZ family protein [Flavobacteriales bacterium]|nr:VanZ family protein [Flavobacteriales bacterium]HCA83572.1 VanZ family protein [Flavobacteriales bacterium]HRE73438.1 VanZ family protein [Flavobacteriales bacterium]HRE96704.1 VanZ family protein [Flavobacteriales bacterium]HRJ34341.1 VanZ family protein [Flavobacteriales bacterium]